MSEAYFEENFRGSFGQPIVIDGRSSLSAYSISRSNHSKCFFDIILRVSPRATYHPLPYFFLIITLSVLFSISTLHKIQNVKPWPAVELYPR